MGRPDESQAMAARETIAKKMKEAELLKAELYMLIQQSPKGAIEEWVNWHKAVLEKILLEPEINSHTKNRANTARKTLVEWENVLTREREYVSIQLAFFVKDYKEKAGANLRTVGGSFKNLSLV